VAIPLKMSKTNNFVIGIALLAMSISGGTSLRVLRMYEKKVSLLFCGAVSCPPWRLVQLPWPGLDGRSL
jgi:hypothetical protein